MRLSKPATALVLVATLLPVAHLVFFLATFLALALGGPSREQAEAWVRLLLVLHVLCILWIWALLAFYLVFLFKTNAVPGDQKALWAVVLFFAKVLAMPVFWYLYVRRSSAEPPAERCA